MSTPGRDPSPEEIREMQAAYEAEMQRITTGDIVIQTAVTLINLAGRRLGLAGEAGSQEERDLDQVRDAIDAVRGLMPVLERHATNELGPLRDALSQLQMAYAQEAQGVAVPAPSSPQGAASTDRPPPPAPPGAGAADPGQEKPGPAQSSGRLWIPGS